MSSKLKSLGEKVKYTEQYDPTQLEGFLRSERREREKLVAPMNGADVWTAFEVSFLKKNGIPEFLVLRISNPADSKNIFESKSLKLYLNSFNNTVVKDKITLIDIVKKDLRLISGSYVDVVEVHSFENNHIYFGARRLEEYTKELVVKEYQYNPELLRTKEAKLDRTNHVELYSNLLRSNCEITNAPDFGRVYIRYEPGEKEVTYESLLEYIVSIRGHQAFHEPTTEIIYNDLFKLLNPRKLLVMCQYTRRGGLDINPIRFTHTDLLPIDLINIPKLIQQ